MKWNIGSTSRSAEVPLSATNQGLPADHPPVGAAAKCPIDHSAMSMSKPKPKPKPKDEGAKCPIDHSAMKGGAAGALGAAVGSPGALNPVNNMPHGLSATDRAPGQKLDLDTNRTLSTIPRPPEQEDGYGGKSSVWEYPSPQQFYNALVRKGWETPEDSIDMIVDIHNFINEGAWDEIMKWEKRRPGGEHAQLARFQGRPGDLSPRARYQLFMSKIFPSKYSDTPPFDRHDWIVTRPVLDAEGKPTKEETSTRYVIDYYSAPNDEDGNPVFSLEVRPALDSFADLTERVRVAADEWMKSGESGVEQ